MDYIQELRNSKCKTKCGISRRGISRIDELAKFVKEFAEVEEINNVPCKKYYELFCIWCDEKGYVKPNPKALGRAVNIAYGITSRVVRIGNNVFRIYTNK